MSFKADDYLAHHGIKGQKWGVRRYQYTDGSLTSEGRRHYGYGNNKKSSSAGRTNLISKVKRSIANRILDTYGKIKISRIGEESEIGKKYVDTYLDKNTPLYRIQSSNQFENFAFYATYKKHDVDEYAGLFGKNLMSRANAEARAAERKANATGDFEEAKVLRDRADNMKVYQLRLSNTSRLRIPSDEASGHIVGKLLNDKEFADDLRASIEDSSGKMRRISQQLLFREAAKSLSKDPAKLSDAEKRTVYKALNLTLTNHNEQEVRMQNKFYGAMKKNGYSALLDLNDRSYSSYHAQSPVIVFDTSRVKLQAVTKMNPKKIDQLYKKHNIERIKKDIPEQVFGNIAKLAEISVSKIADYNVKRMYDYLEKGA